MNKKYIRSAITSIIFLTTFGTNANGQSLDQVLFESSEYLRTGQATEALALLFQHEEAYAEDLEFLNNLAVAHLGNNEPEKALALIREIVDGDPLFSIIAHNYLELELGAAGAKTDRVSPILFVQTVDSFEQGIPVPESVTEVAATAPEEFDDKEAGDDRNLLKDALSSVVQSWAESWSNKEYERYVSHYGTKFDPGSGLSIIEWRSQRKDRLAKPGEIQVTIDNLTVVEGFPSPRVRFDQSYQSVGYSDKTLKELSFEQNNNRWKISSERTITQY